MSRFKNWKQPLINDRQMTKWFWVVWNAQGLTMGKNVDIGAFTFIQAKYGVVLEDNVQVGSHCAIYSENTIDGIHGKVTVKRNACIGSHSTILPNVVIGENAKVGAYSLVKEDVPSGCVVCGVPAQTKRAR